MTDHVLWERAERVLWRRSGSTALLKHPETNDVVQVDRTGLALWSELDGPATLDEVADRLALRYGVDPTQVARDLGPILSELESLQLVRRTCA